MKLELTEIMAAKYGECQVCGEWGLLVDGVCIECMEAENG